MPTMAQRTVWPLRIVVFSPRFDDDPGFVPSVEDFTVEQLIPESGVEASAVTALPGVP